MDWQTAFADHWRDAVEILILAVAIYSLWAVVRRTRGAKVLVSIGIGLLVVMLLAHWLQLTVLSWLFRSLSIFIATSLVILFQPELRRALGSVGSHRFLSLVSQDRASVEVLVETTFDLANRQLGALIAIERDDSLEEFAESGVAIDSVLSQELLVTIFHPKTPLHDGGVIVRSDRIISAACIWPVTQRVDLDRNLGLRHRAGLGLVEEYDALVIVISEETGIVSICHDGVIERNFDPESLRTRLDELLLTPDGKDDESIARPLGREDRLPRARRPGLVPHQEHQPDDRIAF
jgi:diadenylate cyclase